jgi:hypothetical protein
MRLAHSPQHPFLFVMARTVFSLFFSCSLLLAQDTTGIGSISGTLRDETGAVVPGVEVCLAGVNRCVTADAQGRYFLGELRPATYRLRVGEATAEAQVRAGFETRLDILVPMLGVVRESLTVTPEVFTVPEEIKSSAYIATGEEIFKSAGTFQDVSRYVQTLPGIAIGSDDFRNDIIVRGGSPLENLFVVDNVEVPNINTFANFASAGGTVSILDPSLIQDITLLTGGYPAPYINRTSSVLQITQRDGDRERLRGRINVLFGGAGGNLEGPIRKGRGAWIMSARRSFLDLFTNDTGIGGVPVLYTYNAKVSYDLTGRDRIWLVNFTGFDNIRLGINENNRNDDEGELNNLDIRYRGRRSATGFNWQHIFGGNGVGLLGLTHSDAGVDQRVRDVFRGGLRPDLPVPELIARSPIIFREDSRESESTLKYDLTANASPWGRIQAGGSQKFFRVRYDSASPFGNDTPFSRVPDVFPFALQRTFLTTQQGAYAQTTRDFTKRLNATIGARVDRYAFIHSTRVSPRLGLSYRLTGKLTAFANYGHYYQQPFLVFLAVFPENRGLIPFRAVHYVSGLRYAFRPEIRFSVEVFRKTYKDYPVARDIPELSLANLGDTFNVRQILFPLTSAGRGRSQGIEFLIERRGAGRWFGQANFALSSTRHAGLDGVYRAGSFNYERIANLLGGYRLSPAWELGGRLMYLSGRPYTPFDPVLSAAQQRGVFDLSRVNELRLPDYFRLDLRLDRSFTLRGKPALLFLGIQNITNRRNVASFTWNRRLGSVDTNEQLGLFPLVGFEWRL